MYFHLYLLSALVSLTYYASCGSKDRFETLLSSLSTLGGLGSEEGASAAGSSEDQSIDSKEIKEYFKVMSKREQKHYKKAMRQMISKEEKDELKYYENLLKQIKLLNAKN